MALGRARKRRVAEERINGERALMAPSVVGVAGVGMASNFRMRVNTPGPTSAFGSATKRCYSIGTTRLVAFRGFCSGIHGGQVVRPNFGLVRVLRTVDISGHAPPPPHS
jgi:hypothetical protein